MLSKQTKKDKVGKIITILLTLQ